MVQQGVATKLLSIGDCVCLVGMAQPPPRLNADGQPTNPVLLLTSRELMSDFLLSATWKDSGGEFAKFSEYDHTRNRQSLADSTQQIYLRLPSFAAWRQSVWEKRERRRKRDAAA